MAEFHTSRMSEFAAAAAAVGLNWGAPGLSERFGNYKLTHDTEVDQTLSPYSGAYLDQQLALYREISGREFDQESGELHPVDTASMLGTANPKGTSDVVDLGEHTRSLSTVLALAALTGSPHILDMGAGHGVSSEIFAYAGCQVHAIDIDPVLGELSRQRAAVRGYPITRSDANYDDLEFLEDGKYEAAFFFQSLHHCLTPWDLISTLKRKLQPQGVIGFTGEPIQTLWWRNWGLRLDPESLFVARHYGWFESGWSHDFLIDCFARNGMMLDFFSGGNFGGDIGIAVSSIEKRDAIRAKAVTLGLRCSTSGPLLVETQFATLTGHRADLMGRPGFSQSHAGEGYLLYGPYASLAAGSYEAAVLVKSTGSTDGTLSIDIIAGGDQLIAPIVLCSANERHTPQLVSIRFELDQQVDRFEIRACHSGAALWRVSLPTLEKIAG